MQILQQLTQAVPSVYVEHPMDSVVQWVLLIAAGLVLLEWIVSRRR